MGKQRTPQQAARPTASMESSAPSSEQAPERLKPANARSPPGCTSTCVAVCAPFGALPDTAGADRTQQ